MLNLVLAERGLRLPDLGPDQIQLGLRHPHPADQIFQILVRDEVFLVEFAVTRHLDLQVLVGRFFPGHRGGGHGHGGFGPVDLLQEIHVVDHRQQLSLADRVPPIGQDLLKPSTDPGHDLDYGLGPHLAQEVQIGLEGVQAYGGGLDQERGASLRGRPWTLTANSR